MKSNLDYRAIKETVLTTTSQKVKMIKYKTKLTEIGDNLSEWRPKHAELPRSSSENQLQ